MNLYGGYESSTVESVVDSSPTVDISVPESIIGEDYGPNGIVRLTVGELLSAYESGGIFKDSEVSRNMHVLGFEYRVSPKHSVLINATVTSSHPSGFYSRRSTKNSKANKNTTGRNRGAPRGKTVYKVQMRVFNGGEKFFNTTQKCEVRCECPAFQYFLAYPDFKHNALHGDPTGWNTVKHVPWNRGRKRNPDETPGMCKHLAFLLQYLTSQGKFIRH